MAAVLLLIIRGGAVTSSRGAGTRTRPVVGGLTLTSAPLGIAGVPAGAVCGPAGTPAVGGAGSGAPGGITSTVVWSASARPDAIPKASSPAAINESRFMTPPLPRTDLAQSLRLLQPPGPVGDMRIGASATRRVLLQFPRRSSSDPR